MAAIPVWEQIPDDWAVDVYDGPIPDVLHRYRPISPDKLDRLVGFEICQEAIFLAGAGELNDPDEGHIVWTVGGHREDHLAFALETLQKADPHIALPDLERRATAFADGVARDRSPPKQLVEDLSELIGAIVRVACFTTDPLNKPMWAHYAVFADGAKRLENAGCCIEYAAGESWRKLGLHKVNYEPGRPTIDALSTGREKERQFLNAMLLKDTRWNYEEEWRLLAFIRSQLPLPTNAFANSKLRFEGAVRAVTFGPRTPDDVIKHVATEVSSRMPKIALRRVSRDSKTGEWLVVRI